MFSVPIDKLQEMHTGLRFETPSFPPFAWETMCPACQSSKASRFFLQHQQLPDIESPKYSFHTRPLIFLGMERRGFCGAFCSTSGCTTGSTMGGDTIGGTASFASTMRWREMQLSHEFRLNQFGLFLNAISGWYPLSLHSI